MDDLNDAAASLALVCELYGAQARVARNGLEALTVGASFLPDVVLMDISMPHMMGTKPHDACARNRGGRTWCSSH